MNIDILARNILENIGGAPNIEQFNHCATRLRITLSDYSVVNIPALEKENGIIKVVINSGQLQIIIGSHVGEVHKAVKNFYATREVDSNYESSTCNKNIALRVDMMSLRKTVGALSNIITPLFGPIVATGLMKGGLAFLSLLGMVSLASWPVSILYQLHDFMLYLLPILIAYTASLAFGGTPILMLTVAASLLLSPVGDHGLSNLTDIVEFNERYTRTLVPIIICILFSTRIERIAKKLSIKSIGFIATPFLTLTISIPVSLYLLGPFGLWLGKYFSLGYDFLYQMSPIVIGLFISGLWQISVLVGLHWFFALIMLNGLLINGYDTALPLLIPAVLGQAGATFGVWIVNLPARKSNFAPSSIFSAACGLTEPALYQVNIPLRYPFIIGCISAAAGGAWYGLYQIKLYSFGILGLLSVLQMTTPSSDLGTAYHGLIGGLISFLSALIITTSVSLFKKHDKTI